MKVSSYITINNNEPVRVEHMVSLDKHKSLINAYVTSPNFILLEGDLDSPLVIIGDKYGDRMTIGRVDHLETMK